MTSYSLVEHLAKAIWFSGWQEGIFVVFSVYFDASGQESDTQTKYVAVSGFIAHTERWVKWEKDWLECLERRKILNDKGLPEFHMSDCANYTYFFNGWRERESERQELLHELAEIIKGHLGQKVSCIINTDDYKQYIDADLREEYGITGAYVLGGRACAARVKRWCDRDKAPAISQVQLFFEQGDGDRIQADLLTRLIEDEFPRPIFKRKKNKYSKDGRLIEERLIPFQASDVLAYLTNIDAKFAERGHWNEKENIRWMFKDLSKIAEPTCTFPPAHMRGFNTLLRVCRECLL